MDSRPVLTTDSSYKEICQRLAKLTTPLICDASQEVRLMDSKIEPIGNNTQCIGRAYTVNSNQDSLSTMQALDDLQAFLAFLDDSKSDVVPIILTIASCGSPYALAGGMCASVAKAKGFGGVVIDGPCRDLEEIQATNLPFFAKGKCAKSGKKDKVGTRKEQIECGGVKVNPGDIIFADRDGVVAMSKEEAVSAITKGEEIQMKEDIALQKILEGARFNEICNIDEHVENLQSGITPTRLRLTI
jgi:4-hydroxy-4-methyl-2-oxoglutarate aldolase